MKYELIQERNKQLSLLLQVLTNRGIKNVEGYLHTDDSYILDPLKLDNMSGGVRMFLDNQKKKSKVFLTFNLKNYLTGFWKKILNLQ